MPEISRHPHYQEVSARYSLRGPHIAEDLIVPGEDLSRIITYSRPGTPRHRAVADQLRAEGLILGAVIAVRGATEVAQIPLATRPLALESPVHSESGVVYTDANLIFDLGYLCGRITVASHGRVLSGPKAERSFALTDFVEPGVTPLLVLPGTEQGLSNDVPANPLDTQMEAFSSLFTERYADQVGHFVLGYARAVEMGVVS